VSALYDVGETAFVTIRTRDVDGAPVDADATPTATLTPINPPGASSSPIVAHPSVGTYTIAATLPAEGEYALRVVAVVGGSSRIDDRRLAALPEGTAALPAWAPSLADVADHIPTRTRPTAEWGTTDAMLGTFTDATTPTQAQVSRLIRRACSWVAAQVGTPVATSAYGAAGVAAALRAAYWVELGYPERDADLSVYDRLATEADAATGTALAFNAATGAEDPTAGAVDDLVLHSFPDPPAWADAFIN
jgi:hypothetical protein